MHTIALAVLLAVKGTLCFGPKDCAATTAVKIDVTPADAERRFVWTSDDGSKVILGTLPAKAASVDLEAKEPPAHDITLTLHGDSRRGWPGDVRFKLMQGKKEWEWVQPAKTAAKPVTIHAPAARYQLKIAAAHHKSDLRIVDTHSDVAMHDVTLAPLPVVSGRVVTLKKSSDDKPPQEVPVANAQILAAEKVPGSSQISTITKPQASTDEQGTFRTELGEPEPFEIIVTYPGLANRLIHLALSATDTDLGVIRMTPGSKMNVHLDRADSLRSRTLHVTLYQRSPEQYENTSLDKKDAKPGSDDLVFENLGEGEYYVVVSGDDVLENLATTVAMKREDVSKEIRIAPFTMNGSVKLGDEPLREGQVGVTDYRHTWRGEVPIDSEGRFGGTMWQRDLLSGYVHSKTLGTLPLDGAVKLEGDPATWNIAFKRRMISGRVFDEETKQPVAKANMELQVTATAWAFYSSVEVHDDGSYSVVALRDGTYDLQAKAPDHVAVSKSVTVGEKDESQTVDFALGRGVEQKIEFVWPSGEPIANAMVVEGVARDGHNPAWYASTDASGKLDLRSPPNTARTLFVIPREGSFAPVHVPAATADAAPMRVVVPMPTAVLSLKIETPEHKPGPAILAMRYNGEWVPFSVVSSLRRQAAGAAVRYPLMPSGAYELWAKPNRSRDNAVPSWEPVRVGLDSGEQAVTLTLPPLP